MYRKISNAVMHKLSRALSFTSQGEISSLSDTILLKILLYLPTEDLLSACKVCKKWNQLCSHPMLWRCVDLRCFSKPLHDKSKLEHVADYYLAHKVVTLDMSAFTVPQSVLNLLATTCPDLRKLVLKSVTLTKEQGDQVQFPTKLSYLDIRYSHGPIEVYKEMSQHLNNINWLGICDGLILAISNEQTKPNAFLNLENLEKLDVSHCKLMRDSFLFKFSSCQKLRLLSLRKCALITGESLPIMIARLKGLETLILDETSVQDEYLELVDWKNTNIKYLELGWCPLITTSGLQSYLPKVAQMPQLEYLGLCNIGQGKALTDANLEQLALQLQQDTCPKLHSLNISFSNNITDDGLEKFENMFYIETVDVSKCAQLTEDDDEGITFQAITEDSTDVFENGVNSNTKAREDVDAKTRRNSSRTSLSSMGEVFRRRSTSGTSLSSMNDMYRPRNGSRVSLSSMGEDAPRIRRRSSRGSFSTIQFAMSNYTLETPL